MDLNISVTKLIIAVANIISSFLLPLAKAFIFLYHLFITSSPFKEFEVLPSQPLIYAFQHLNLRNYKK